MTLLALVSAGDYMAFEAASNRIRFTFYISHRWDVQREIFPPLHGLDAMTAMARSILDTVINAIRRYLWCRDVEEALENGIKFLQDHDDQLCEQQKKDFRKDLAGQLDSYSDIC